mmetsp:Transcript_38836/g.121964  ORF Transcript_38836/g.121964 Transcript_38836/m.121964 type:complete len:466 (-) Transcript_38836:98-1495(-)
MPSLPPSLGSEKVRSLGSENGRSLQRRWEEAYIRSKTMVGVLPIEGGRRRRPLGRRPLSAEGSSRVMNHLFLSDMARVGPRSRCCSAIMSAAVRPLESLLLGAAPARRSESTASAWLPLAARRRASKPSSFLRCTLAPAARSSSKTSQCPPCAAFISAVWPISSRRSASSTPEASSARTTSRKPPAAAAGSASARSAEERASSGAVRPSAARRISGRRMQRSAPVRAPFASALTARTAWTRSASPRICGSCGKARRVEDEGDVLRQGRLRVVDVDEAVHVDQHARVGLEFAARLARANQHHHRLALRQRRRELDETPNAPKGAPLALGGRHELDLAGACVVGAHPRDGVEVRRAEDEDGARAHRLCKALDVRLVLRGVWMLVHRERVHPHPLVLVEHIGDCRDQVREAALPAVRGKRVRLAHAALATHRWQVDVPALPPFRERLDYTLHELRRRPRQVRACKERL